MAEREYDVIVWGATGFTGQLVVDYLAETYGTGGELRWAIGGRNLEKLQQVRKRALPAGQQETLPIIQADSDDGDSLAAMVAQTRVVCTTVGPYAKFGTPLVAACAEAGTDYCDLTGEVQWMARVIPRFEQTAADSGARIVHTCGFDSVPFDMGVWHLQQLMQQTHGVYASEVKGRVGASRGAASGGTIASILNMLEEAQGDPELRDKIADPYVLYPADTPAGTDTADQRSPIFDPDFDQWTSPFIMAAINTRVVRRTNALLGLPWGADFRYSESVLNSSRGQATMVSAGAGLGMLTLAIGPTRRLMQRFLPKPGEGPSRDQREAGHYEIFFHGIHPADRSKDLRIRVTGDLDPGYGSTSRMLGEAAACLALDKANTGGGFWTPAAALSGAYLERLQSAAGLNFEQVIP